MLRLLTAGYGTSRTSGDVRLESAKWAKADIDQVRRRFRFAAGRERAARREHNGGLRLRSGGRSVGRSRPRCAGVPPSSLPRGRTWGRVELVGDPLQPAPACTGSDAGGADREAGESFIGEREHGRCPVRQRGKKPLCACGALGDGRQHKALWLQKMPRTTRF